MGEEGINFPLSGAEVGTYRKGWPRTPPMGRLAPGLTNAARICYS